MNPTSWSPLRPVPGLLEPGVKAPIPVPQEPASSYSQALSRLLDDITVPGGPRKAALASGTLLLHGAQLILATANEFTMEEPSPGVVQDLSLRLLRLFLALKNEVHAAFVLRQVAEIAASQRSLASGALKLERLPRLKDFMTPLERCLEALEVQRRMESRRFGALLVHLDEIYDDASVQIQRFFSLSRRDLSEAQLLAPEFLGKLYSEFARASFSDHLLSERAGGEIQDPQPGSSLLALLPELIQVLS